MTPEQERKKYGDWYKTMLHAPSTIFDIIQISDEVSAEEALDLLTKKNGSPENMQGSMVTIKHIIDEANRLSGDSSHVWDVLGARIDSFIDKTAGSNFPSYKRNIPLSTNILFFTYHLWNNGAQTFSLSPRLAHSLMHTDVSNTDVKDVRLPFPSFLLRIPRGVVAIEDEETGRHDVDTIAVVGNVDKRNRVSFLFCGAENTNSKMLGDDTTTYIHLGFEGNFRDALNRSVNNIHENVISRDDAVNALAPLVNLAVASILYITDFPDDRERYLDKEINEQEKKMGNLSGKEKKNAKSKLRKMRRDGTNVVVVGGVYGGDDSLLDDLSSGRKIKVASYVRGHRRMQAYGLGRSLRKPVWIKPHWRNIGGENKERRYRVV
jgi:hypothetical protein